MKVTHPKRRFVMTPPPFLQCELITFGRECQTWTAAKTCARLMHLSNAGSLSPSGKGTG